MDELTFSPFDSVATHSMFPEMRTMRTECPVLATTEGYWYISRFHDNIAMFKDARTWANAGGWRESWVEMPVEDRFLGELDSPRHRELRRPMIEALSPRDATNAEPFAAQYLRSRLERLVELGGGDLVQQVTLPMPQAVTAHVLGFPEADVDQVGAWCFDLIHSTWPSTNATERGSGIGGAFPEFAAYLDQQIRMRHLPDRPDDLLSRMLHAPDGRRRMTDWDARTQAAGLLAASLSTTALMGNLFHRLLTDPDFDARLRTDRQLIVGAVEESLRLEPPVMLLFRTASNDAEVAGCPIAAGDRVVLGIASANRDEEVFGADADEFRPDRSADTEHLSFGIGPHTCPGKNIARMEARVTLETYFDMFEPGQVRLADDFRYEFVPMFLEYGPQSLSVVIDR